MHWTASEASTPYRREHIGLFGHLMSQALTKKWEHYIHILDTEPLVMDQRQDLRISLSGTGYARRSQYRQVIVFGCTWAPSLYMFLPVPSVCEASNIQPAYPGSLEATVAGLNMAVEGWTLIAPERAKYPLAAHPSVSIKPVMFGSVSPCPINRFELTEPYHWTPWPAAQYIRNAGNSFPRSVLPSDIWRLWCFRCIQYTDKYIDQRDRQNAWKPYRRHKIGRVQNLRHRQWNIYARGVARGCVCYLALLVKKRVASTCMLCCSVVFHNWPPTLRVYLYL